MKIIVAHMYPELLNIYADRGNISVLQRRASWRGIELIVHPITKGNPLPVDTNLVYIGGGQDRDQFLVADDIMQRAEELDAFVESNGTVLAVCGGYQLLGRLYCDTNGKKLLGAGIFPVNTVAEETRLIGNVLLRCSFDNEEIQSVSGFENHAGRTHLDIDAKPFGKVIYGFGNTGKSGYEGCRRKNAIGTYLHGPLLPRNPWLADWLLKKALEHGLGAESDLSPLDDSLEFSANTVACNRARTLGGKNKSLIRIPRLIRKF